MPKYGPPGALSFEDSVQEAVDIMWFSFPDETPIIIEEWADVETLDLSAVWIVPNPYESDTAPIACSYHRVEL